MRFRQAISLFSLVLLFSSTVLGNQCQTFQRSCAVTIDKELNLQPNSLQNEKSQKTQDSFYFSLKVSRKLFLPLWAFSFPQIFPSQLSDLSLTRGTSESSNPNQKTQIFASIESEPTERSYHFGATFTSEAFISMVREIFSYYTFFSPIFFDRVRLCKSILKPMMKFFQNMLNCDI